MTDKERLEGIIQSDILRAIDYGFDGHNVRREKILADVDWLIKRVEELELEVNDWRAEVQKWQKFYKESEESHLETKELLKNIVNQNKRYREVLQLITNRISFENEYVPIEILFEIKKIVDEALEK